MTDYRIVSRHVRYWRGNVHKWSTVWPFVGTISSTNYSPAIDAIHEMEQAVCYPAPGGGGGGIWEVAMYDQSSGGVPVLVKSYFDPETPGTWVPYSGSAWSSLTTALEGNAEVALQAEWLAGLSRTGKPVRFRKWFHAVPQLASGNTSPDVNSGNRASLVSVMTSYLNSIGGLGAPMGRGSRLAGTSGTVLAFYGNHQMPRGRRKAPMRISSSIVKLPPGLLVVPGSDGSLDS